MKPKVYYFGIDTSSGWASFGLVDDQGVVASTAMRSRESRAQGLVPRIRGFLANCGVAPEGLAGMGVVVGPGSFTALRVGVSSAQGLALGLGIPLVPVETHAAVARSIPLIPWPVLILVPARKGEVFAQTFTREPGIGWVSRDMIECLKVEDLSKISESPASIAGPALAAYGEEIAAVYEGRVPLAPEGSWAIRGESVALIARERITERQSDFDPAEITIRYLQSHGALTILEREKADMEKR